MKQLVSSKLENYNYLTLPTNISLLFLFLIFPSLISEHHSALFSRCCMRFLRFLQSQRRCARFSRFCSGFSRSKDRGRSLHYNCFCFIKYLKIKITTVVWILVARVSQQSTLFSLIASSLCLSNDGQMRLIILAGIRIFKRRIWKKSLKKSTSFSVELLSERNIY